ncbi:hypothetical protein REIFOR_02519 [Reinekea forsetii]|uniref:Uncharacterized protein n=1 Tax=Reinekea forsetii TaxID=1336806 RepID=A0A2K8KX60_9GAMM|nr:hypothetical protein REIFOR_02519 [Reinekea forsetii]
MWRPEYRLLLPSNFHLANGNLPGRLVLVTLNGMVKRLSGLLSNACAQHLINL